MVTRLLAAAAVLALVGGTPTAQAQTTITMMHVEQNPTIQAYWNDIARRFEAQRPGVKLDLQFLENESYKKKMPTLLQSSDRPNIIYSWGGGVMREQIKAGAIQDITAAMDADWKGRFSEAAVQAYTVDGKMWGVPMHTSQVGFFYNRDLFAKAGVDGEAIKTWDDLLGAVRKLKGAGVVPITAGGADKWPLHFYWTHLAMRIGGKTAIDEAMSGKGKGFASETFVRAGELFKQLIDLQPFQPGVLGASYPQSSGQFGDGKAAMVLQGNFVLNSMRANSADKKGLADDKLGWFAFPTVPGGKGDPNDTLGGLNGWLITKGAPKEALEFMRFFSQPENQRIAAERGFYIPIVKGTADAIQSPHLRRVAENVGKSRYHQIFYDQALGPSVGQVVNDISAELAAGRITPAKAAESVNQAWQLAN
jgi:raffinose/stachyose/melibiose transport system substrate-binding protein